MRFLDSSLFAALVFFAGVQGHAMGCSDDQFERGCHEVALGSDGGGRACQCPARTRSLDELTNDEPIFDVFLNINGEKQRVRCCGGHHLPRECPCDG